MNEKPYVSIKLIVKRYNACYVSRVLYELIYNVNNRMHLDRVNRHPGLHGVLYDLLLVS